MKEKLETETQETIERPLKMETRFTAYVNTNADNSIRTTCEKMVKSHAKVKAIRPKEAINVHSWAPMKATTDMDLNIQKSVRIQGLQEDHEYQKMKVSSRPKW